MQYCKLLRMATQRPILVAVIFSFLFTVRADGLVTAYVSFEHPDGWRCELSQGVWICQSSIEQDRRESVVLSIATMRTEWDSMENYLDYLKKPREIPDEEGKLITSKVIYARKRNINGLTWIDSLQQNSELPGFWARYVATVQDKLAILITYIVSDEYYSKLAPQFERMVSSLKPNAEFDLNIATKQGEMPIPGSEKLGGTNKDMIKNLLGRGKSEPKKPEETAAPPAEEGQSTIVIIVLVVGVCLVYLLWRRSQRRKNIKKATSMQARRPPGS